MRMKRVFFDIFLFISILILPWWVSAIVAFAGIFLFEQYFEFVIGFLMMYALYSAKETQVLASPLGFSVILSSVYIAIQAVRSNMIFYQNKS